MLREIEWRKVQLVFPKEPVASEDIGNWEVKLILLAFNSVNLRNYEKAGLEEEMPGESGIGLETGNREFPRWR